MAFGFFKKKKKDTGPHYDPTNIGVMDIRKGFVFDFNNQTWEVEEEFEYDWGNNDFTYEFKVVSESDTFFFYVEEDDEIECIFSQKIPFAKLDGSVESKILKKGRPPKTVIYNGIEFYRDEESLGYFRPVSSENWKELISWTYYDEEEATVLTIEQWGERDFEASMGAVVKPSSITNILPVAT